MTDTTTGARLRDDERRRLSDWLGPTGSGLGDGRRYASLIEVVERILTGRLAEPRPPPPTPSKAVASVARTEYVVGFAFDTRARVALIRKNRPEWQAGRLNGIGGHVEPGETPDGAMGREFWEETGTRLTGWQKYVVMDFPGARIHFYRLRDLHPIRLDGLRSTTDEVVVVIDHRDLGQSGAIPNLTWLVPLAAYSADTYELIQVRASMAEVIDAPEHATNPAGGGERG